MSNFLFSSHHKYPNGLLSSSINCVYFAHGFLNLAAFHRGKLRIFTVAERIEEEFLWYKHLGLDPKIRNFTDSTAYWIAILTEFIKAGTNPSNWIGAPRLLNMRDTEMSIILNRLNLKLFDGDFFDKDFFDDAFCLFDKATFEQKILILLEKMKANTALVITYGLHAACIVKAEGHFFYFNSSIPHFGNYTGILIVSYQAGVESFASKVAKLFDPALQPTFDFIRLSSEDSSSKSRKIIAKYRENRDMFIQDFNTHYSFVSVADVGLSLNYLTLDNAIAHARRYPESAVAKTLFALGITYLYTDTVFFEFPLSSKIEIIS